MVDLICFSLVPNTDIEIQADLNTPQEIEGEEESTIIRKNGNMNLEDQDTQSNNDNDLDIIFEAAPVFATKSFRSVQHSVEDHHSHPLDWQQQVVFLSI
jgi:hypothetical protein